VSDERVEETRRRVGADVVDWLSLRWCMCMMVVMIVRWW
jgi:hypothetical protein